MRAVRWSASGRFVGAIFVALLMAATVQSQVRVTTVAGGYPDDGQPATAGALMFPQFVAVDSAGNLYISDFWDHRVREVSASTGTITTFVGTGVAGYGRFGTCVQANTARIRFPRGIAAAPSGTVYFADSGNQRIESVVNGCKYRVVGNGTAGYAGDDMRAVNAELNWPYGLALDSAGNLYIADFLNSAIRVVDTQGYIHTVAGNGTAGYSGDGGSATKAQLNLPRGIWVDSSNNLYIADTNNHVVRMVTPWQKGPIVGGKHTIIAGTITTIAGNGSTGCSGDGGAATAASIGPLRDVAVSNGTLFISNGGCNRIRAVNLGSGIITTFAGSSIGYDGEGNPPLSAMFSTPTGLAFDNSGNLLVADAGNARVRQVTSTVNTVAGGYTGDGGAGTKSALNVPENIAFDAKGNMYIAEANGNRVRKLSGGTIKTFAGSSTGISGYGGDNGPATKATLSGPLGLAVDSQSNLYIADSNNNVIRKVNPSGQISTFAQYGSFSSLASLATDTSNNVYAADQGSCVVWQVTPAAVVSVVAGEVGNCGYNADGIPATSALLNSPYGVAVDSAGNVYIGDTGNNRVRVVNPSGMISTLTGNGVCGYSGDGGSATAAEVCTPKGVAMDASGNLYIGDWGNGVVRLVNGSGVISTLAGTGKGTGYNGNNLLATNTNLDGPVAIAVKPGVNVPYLADDQQYRVRRIQ